MIALINQTYLFLFNSHKRQRMFDLTVKTYLAESSHSKLTVLRTTRWIERHICLEVFLEVYETLVIFLDAILTPSEYTELVPSDGSWNWDTDTKVKAQGLKASNSSFQTIVVFIIAKSILDDVRPLTVKLQRRDQDVAKAYEMVDNVIDCMKFTKEEHRYYIQVLVQRGYYSWPRMFVGQRLSPGGLQFKGFVTTHRSNVLWTNTREQWQFH